MNMDFGTNKFPTEVITKGSFREIYFRCIYCLINDKWYKNSWIESNELKDVDKKYYCSND